MLNFGIVDPRLLDDVSHVVEELMASADVDPTSILLVGAHCRNVLHQALGFAELPGVSSTGDVDLGLVLSDWESFERITATFTRVGGNGIRYVVAGMPVDVMPFGASVEDPSGITSPPSAGGDLVVFGLDQVFAASEELTLPGSVARIRIPTPVGYAVLKMRAWADRSERGVWKDAKDLALVLSWYEHSDVVGARVWDVDSDVSDRYDWDPERASAHLLGRDMRMLLSAGDAEDLAGRFASSDMRLFADQAGIDPVGRTRGRGLAIAEALVSGLRDEAEA